MKKKAHSLCILLIVALVGCDGQSVTGQSGGRTVLPPQPPPPPPPVPPAQSLGCSTLRFAKTTDVDALPGGIWSGELFDCTFNGAIFATAMITEDGRFHIVLGEGRLLTGTLGTTGNLVDGHGIDYARQGMEYFSGPFTGLFVQGSLLERQKLESRWGTEWGGYGYFDFDYRQQTYERPTPLADLAGAWSQGYVNFGNPVGGVWTVETDGSFTGQDEVGCLYSGQFSLIDERFSIVAVDVAVSACASAGTYAGLAYLEDLVDWYEKTITVSVDNGIQALHIGLSIERP